MKSKMEELQLIRPKKRALHLEQNENIVIQPEEGNKPTILFTKIETTVNNFFTHSVTYDVSVVRIYNFDTEDFGKLYVFETEDITDTTTIESEEDLDFAVQKRVLIRGNETLNISSIFTEEDINKNSSILNNCLQDYLFETLAQVLGEDALSSKSFNLYYWLHD